MKITELNKDMHLNDYIAVLKRRKWIIISFFLITVTTITLATFIQKNVYRATSTVIVDAESPDILSVKDVVKLGESNYFAYKDYIETQQEIIKSRRMAYTVFKHLKLGDREEFKKAKDPIETLLKRLRVEVIRNTRILKLSIDDRDPAQASRIANEFAKVYANSNITLKLKASAEAGDWLKTEVDKQKAKVREAELKLQTYKERNDMASTENKVNIINDSLDKLNASYLEAQKNRVKSETTYKSLVDKEGNIKEEQLPTLLTDNDILKELKMEFLGQQTTLAKYRMVYKDRHPKMIALLDNIEYSKVRIKKEVENEYIYAKDQEGSFKKLLDDKKRESLELERKIIDYNALKRELDTNERILEIVLNRFKETAISSQIQTNNIRVQDLAEVPRNPIKPKKKLNVALGVIIGLIGGTMLAFFKDYMDTSIKDPSQIAELLQISVLGSVPKMKIDGRLVQKKSDIDMIVEKDSTSLASEAYRTIRTNLIFSLNDTGSSKSIVVTSSMPREGKTLTAINLAIIIANSGEKVLLVDADMRKPKIHTVFNKTHEMGLSQFLAGEKGFDDILNFSGIDNLYFVTAGKTTHRSAELISSKNMNLFLEKAGSLFQKIIFDTPPVGLVTDATLLSTRCSGTVLVTDSPRAKSQILTRSKELLDKVNARLLGIIINNVSLANDSYYYPHYYYGKYYKPSQTK